MDFSDAAFRFSAKGLLGRTLPRTGAGKQPFGAGRLLQLPDCDLAWQAEIDLAAAGDNFTIDLSNGEVTVGTLPAGMTIGGTTSPSVAGLLLPAATNGGKIYYSSDGTSVVPAAGTWIRLYWTTSPARWNLQRYVDGALTHEWRSSSDTTSPADATGWAAVSPASGTPTVTSTARTALVAAGGDGNNAEGIAFGATPMNDIRLLLIEVLNPAGEPDTIRAGNLAFDHQGLGTTPAAVQLHVNTAQHPQINDDLGVTAYAGGVPSTIRILAFGAYEE